jgi:predicted transcriptional regulator
MINKILACVENMKAIDRFIFLGLLYQKRLIIEGNRKSLANHYGFSEGVVDRTLNGLVDTGFLEKNVNEKNSEKRGRPTYKYKNIILEKLSIDLDVDLNVNKVFANNHIKSLFSDNLHPPAHHKLKADTKLLLIVLINNADTFGFVQSLENTILLKLTGMKRQALDGQIQKLIDFGYIRSKVSGINSKYLFGRMSSIYILNLQHVNFANCSEQTRKFLYFKHPDSLLYKPRHKLIGNQRFINFSAPGTFEAQKLIQLSNGMINLLNKVTLTDQQKKDDWETRHLYSEIMQLIDYEQFKKIAILFITKSNPECFATFLQFKLNQYASELLSENTFQPNINNEAVKDKIRNEIFHPNLDAAIIKKVEFKQLLFSESSKVCVVELIYSISLLIARDISKVLSARNLPENTVFIQATLRILPALQDDFRYLTVDSNCKVEHGKTYFLYGDTIVKKSEVNCVLVAEDVLMYIDGKYTYKAFTYGEDSEVKIARKLLQKIEPRYLESHNNLSDQQLYCFSLHHMANMNYSTEEGNDWLSSPKDYSELYQ